MSGEDPPRDDDGQPADGPDGSPADQPDGTPADQPDGAPAGKPDGAPADRPADEDPSPSTVGLLADARKRLAGTPEALLALLVAGLVVAATDWLRLQDPVPTAGYVGVQQGDVSVKFGVLVSVLSRADTPLSALLHLKRRWLVWAVGLELLAFAAVVLASTFALARLLGVDLRAAAVARYGLVLGVLEYLAFEANFEGGAIILGIPLLVLFFVVLVRLVPLPGRLVLGEGVVTALGRSWATARGHGWSLFGVVLVLGLANHLLASVPVVGPVGSAAVAAWHAGVVAEVVERLPAARRGESAVGNRTEGPDGDRTCEAAGGSD